MEEFREEVVTTTTTEAAPGPPVRQATVVAPARTTTQTVEQVTVDPYEARRTALYRMWQVVWLVVGIAEGLIAIRFVLRLLGANPDAGFAQLIYGITAPLVAPFAGLFGTPRFEGSAFEFTSLVAMLVYALLAWVIVKIVFMFFSETRTGAVTQRTVYRS
jgi:YggT family protein